jgi:hypothetical protein
MVLNTRALLPIVIAVLGKHHLERANLITANRSHMTAVDGERDCLGFGRRREDSAINVPARAYGSKDAIFAMMRSYSGVHRSGMISATGLTV